VLVDVQCESCVPLANVGWDDVWRGGQGACGQEVWILLAQGDGARACATCWAGTLVSA